MIHFVGHRCRMYFVQCTISTGYGSELPFFMDGIGPLTISKIHLYYDEKSRIQTPSWSGKVYRDSYWMRDQHHISSYYVITHKTHFCIF
jgi:hypothetical protein